MEHKQQEELVEELSLFHKESQLYHVGGQTTYTSSVFAIVNGMISGAGVCVIMPQLGLHAGWLTTIWTCSLAAFISYYTARLIVIHLGKAQTIRECILEHFDNNYLYVQVYGFLIWTNFFFSMIIFFRIICLQVIGLLGFSSVWIGPSLFLLLMIIVLTIRLLHVTQELLAWGTVSIFTYLIFIAWSIITAPAGPKTVPVTGSSISILASLMMGYSIQDFMVQSLIKNPNRNQYPGIVKSASFLGFIGYMFMAFGSFGIVNRPPVTKHPQTINDYFHNREWQITIIEIIMVIQMVSIYPAYLIFSKIRFFQIFKIDVSKSIKLREVVYIIMVIGFCLLVYITNINLQTLINIDGAIIGYFYMILVPIILHLKCIWKDRHSGRIQNEQLWNRDINPNACECDNTYSSKFTLHLDTFLAVGILIAGFVLMVFDLIKIFHS